MKRVEKFLRYNTKVNEEEEQQQMIRNGDGEDTADNALERNSNTSEREFFISAPVRLSFSPSTPPSFSSLPLLISHIFFQLNCKRNEDVFR